jgi:hypothetical protein
MGGRHIERIRLAIESQRLGTILDSSAPVAYRAAMKTGTGPIDWRQWVSNLDIRARVQVYMDYLTTACSVQAYSRASWSISSSAVVACFAPQALQAMLADLDPIHKNGLSRHLAQWEAG